MIERKKGKSIRKKSVSVLAAAVLAASLLGGSVYSVAAGNGEKTVTASTLFPENITISEPVALSEVTLPESKYGKFKWADDSFVPEERVQECEVIFIPSGKKDLSDIKGYDEETGHIKGYVTVVVSSIEGDCEDWEEDTEDSWEEDGEPDLIVEPEVTVTPEGEMQPEVTVTPEGEVQPEATVTPETEAAPEGEVQPEATVTPESETQPEVTVTPEGEAQPEATVTPEGEMQPETETSPENETQPETTVTPESETQPEATVAPEEIIIPEGTPVPDNIFDHSEEESEDQRPSDVDEELSQEEMAERAEINHSCNGISVSGINLPWYVQFRATSGESYAFTNQTDAAIFKSYEFELWDLKNQTEYMIPDGEYISVTVPVKEGYEYSVEHILDNGATETIIPNVENGLMVFSTHSFSPFGIAGSKPIVDSGITEDGYGGEVTPTKVPDNTTNPAVPNAPSVTKIPTDSEMTDSTSQGNMVGQSSEKTENAQQPADQTMGRTSVNTGDSTMILPFVILIIVAAIAAGVVIYLKKKHK